MTCNDTIKTQAPTECERIWEIKHYKGERRKEQEFGR